MITWARHVARVGVMTYLCKILIRTPEGRRLFRISRLRWKDNIKMDIKDKVLERTGWIYLAEGRGQ
jgi:hypothetical protein